MNAAARTNIKLLVSALRSIAYQIADSQIAIEEFGAERDHNGRSTSQKVEKQK